MTHRLLTDADLEPVSDAQLQAAIAVVAAMSDDDFYIIARRLGLDPWRGRSGVYYSNTLLDRLDAELDITGATS